MEEAGVDGALIVQPIDHKFDHSYVSRCVFPILKTSCLSRAQLVIQTIIKVSNKDGRQHYIDDTLDLETMGAIEPSKK
jgi:hypothetical protein